MTIEKNLLSLSSSLGITLELSIDNRIMTVLSSQHLCHRSMLLEKRSKESSPTSAILSVIWSR
jgi:hypothetical protein